MSNSAEQFLKKDLLSILKQLKPDQKAVWGKMDAQQMVEHLRDVCKVANGKIVLPLYNNDPAQLAKARAFLMSDLPFQENLRVPVMPEEPRAHKYAGMEEAIAKTMEELGEVFKVYADDPHLVLMHPMFGALNYTEQLHYLEKHIRHHLRQFEMVD